MSPNLKNFLFESVFGGVTVTIISKNNVIPYESPITSNENSKDKLLETNAIEATNTSNFEVSILLDKPVIDFTIDHIKVKNMTLNTDNNDNLSNFKKITDLEYSVEFTTSNSGTFEIYIPEKSFVDSIIGIYNYKSLFRFTVKSPEISILSNDITHNSITNKTTIKFKIEITAETDNFEKTDIKISGGELINFVSIDKLNYTVDFKPSKVDYYEVKILENAFTNNTGINNKASNTFSFNFDNVQPTINITSSDIENNTKSNRNKIKLNLDFNKNIKNFKSNLITFNGGYLSNFEKINDTNYIVYLNASKDETYNVFINENAFSDDAGNLNKKSNTFTWIRDTVRPTITITSNINHSSRTNNETIVLNFETSEIITDFTVDKIKTNNGDLSNFTANKDGKNFSVDLKVFENKNTIITVDENTITDRAGNKNIASNTFEFFYDNVKPTVKIITDDIEYNSRSANKLIDFEFKISEINTTFDIEDIYVKNGILSEFKKEEYDNFTYSVKFKPIEEGDCEINVAENNFSDEAGNLNEKSNVFSWVYDNNSSPMIMISSKNISDKEITNKSNIKLIFESTEKIKNFEVSDIVLNKGELVNFKGSGKMFTAELNAEIDGKYTIRVPENTFTDLGDSNNVNSNIFQFTYDSTPPTMTILSNEITSGSTTDKKYSFIIYP